MSRLLSNKVIGIIACIIYLFITVFSGWQFIAYCRHARWHQFSTRKMFHIFLILYCVLQFTSLYSFCLGYYYEKWSFSCHMFAICCEVIAVSFVAILWSKTLVSTNNAFRRVIPSLIIVDGFMVAYSIVACLDLLHSKQSFEEWSESSVIFNNLLLVEPIALFVNGLCLVYLGLRIRNRLIRDPSWEKLPLQQKQMVMFRLLGTMVVCSLCYAARCGMELYLYIIHDEYIINHSGWAASMWLPSLLPACILTYTMRRTEVEVDDDDVDDQPKEPPKPGALNKISKWSSSLAESVASIVVPSSSLESQANNDAAGGSEGQNMLYDNFDNVIAPLLATTILAENAGDDEVVEGGRASTMSQYGVDRQSLHSPFQQNYSSGQSMTTSGGNSGNLSRHSASGMGNSIGARVNRGHNSTVSPMMGNNINVNLIQATPTAAKSLVRTKSVRSESELSDS